MSGRQEVTGSIPVSSTILTLFLLFAPGCDEGDPDDGIRDYPLEAGTTWVYRRSITAELVGTTDGLRVVEDTVAVVSQGEVFVASAGGPVALLDMSPGPSPGPPSLSQAYSRDSAGLRFHPLLSTEEDATALPKPGWAGARRPSFRLFADATPDGDPRLVLAFPVTLGNAWLARREPYPVLRRVVGRDMLDLPAGRFRAFEIATIPYGEAELPHTDWIGDPGLLRRTREFLVDEFLFPGHPAVERVREDVALLRFVAGGGR